MITHINGINIHSIACAVPKQKLSLVEYAPDLFDEKAAKRMAKGTGFASLRISDDDTTTADLCVLAAEKMFVDIDRRSIGALVFVTQTPDYILPATSHVLQEKLGLRNDIICLDINEGCSGYVTGIYVSAMLAKQLNTCVCLLVGDTVSKLTLPADRATRCIFGDAGTATIVEPGVQDTCFSFASYGDRFESIIMESSRHKLKADPLNGGKLYLDGIVVMNFTLNEVPELIKEMLAAEDIDINEISFFACHQANKIILQFLAERMNVQAGKIPFTAGENGNESLASIPMVLTAVQDFDGSDLSKVVCVGFGVGFSIGAFIYDFTNTRFYGVSEL